MRYAVKIRCNDLVRQQGVSLRRVLLIESMVCKTKVLVYSDYIDA